jgi:hypothetical protein
MECPHCHAENTDDSRFCRQCATPLPWAERGGAGASQPFPTRTLERRRARAGLTLAL